MNIYKTKTSIHKNINFYLPLLLLIKANSPQTILKTNEKCPIVVNVINFYHFRGTEYRNIHLIRKNIRIQYLFFNQSMKVFENQISFLIVFFFLIF